MTIRRQIFLFVLPLFVGFAAIGSVGSWWLETTDARLAFNDEARSLAIAIAEFIEPDDVAAVRAGTPPIKTRLGPIISRLQRWGIVKRLYLLEPATGKVLADTAPAGTPAASLADIQGLGPTEVRALPWRDIEGGSTWAPLVTRTERAPGILGVELSANGYIDNRDGIVVDVVRDGLLVGLFGLAVAAILGALLRRQVRQLQRSAETIGGAAFVDAPADAMVREVADLGNTFGVMHSVHEETVDRTRRSLAEGDYYRGERALTDAFQRELQPKSAWTGGAAAAAWLPVGEPPPAALAGALATGPADGTAFVGTAGGTGDLVAVLRARAAAAFLADALVRLPMSEAATEAAALFGLDRLIVVQWRGDRLARWSSNPDDGHELDATRWATGASVPLACLGPVNRERLDLYLANFPAHPVAALLEDLPPLLDAREPGVVLVLRRAS